MTDVHNKATRSKNMRAIGTRDTAIEKRLAGLLTEAGFDFRVQDAALAGRPDFVIDAYECIIFTHGCFWHRHDCYLFKVPATRTDFWLEKIGKTSSAIGGISARLSNRDGGCWWCGSVRYAAD